MARALVAFVRAPLSDPLTPECLVVQGRGMALYLMRELAHALGVCANTDFSYPRNFVQRALGTVLNDADTELLPDRDRLKWDVLAELPKHLGSPRFTRIRDFLAHDSQGIKRLQLATRTAELFDRYLTYRPELIRDWESATRRIRLPDEHAWQADLWAALAPRFAERHVAARELRFYERLARAPAGEIELPARVSVFGISSLPPLYVRVLGALCSRVDVRLYLFSPCQEYWADLPNARRVERAIAPGVDTRLLHLDGHPLLSALGKLGAEFQQVLANELDALGVQTVEHDLYAEPAERCLLGRLQADVLHLGDVRDRQGAPAATPAGEGELSSTDDRSIALHSCHSPMRQVEVLHDQLLALFEEQPDLEPHDVVVMMPDVEEYAPLVEAVFERDRQEPSFIPYSISDRASTCQSPLHEAFLRVLRLVGRRAKASEVLDVLTLEVISEKLSLSADDLEKLTRWISESRIRWGIDAEHRREHDQPGTELNTWQFGLDRMLLGYALAGAGTRLFAGMLPYDEIEGQDAELLGRLANFVSALFARLVELEQARRIENWQTTLGSVLEELFATEGRFAAQAQRIRSALGRLQALAEAACFEEDLSLAAVVALLEEELDDADLARGFLAGGVTFCAMVPMRSIPHKVVCLLGMNEGDFPRADRFTDFDLTRPNSEFQLGAKPGDRSRRDDDRYLFLEALMAARERLLIFFTGQSIRDNSPVPPSVVVNELLDYARRSSARKDCEKPGAPARAVSILRHPLQPFSSRYFNGSDPALFSYVASYCTAAQEPHASIQRRISIFDGPLSFDAANDLALDIALSELTRFFEGPIRYLFKRGLRLELEERSLAILDREPWELSKLDEWEIGKRLLELDLSEKTNDSFAIARASGELPLGTPGRYAHDLLQQCARPIAEKVLEVRATGSAANLSVNLRLPDGTHLSGELTGRAGSGLLVAQYSRVTGKHLLCTWIRHLTLCAVLQDATEVQSIVIGRPRDPKSKAPYSSCTFRRVSEAGRELVQLIDLFRVGQSRPLLLFPKTSFEYARKLNATGDAEQALRAARDVWGRQSGPMDGLGECADPHLDAAFGPEYVPGAAPPFETPPSLGFEVLAERVFAPLLDHLVGDP